MRCPMSVVEWLDSEQRKASRWVRSADGVFRFSLTGAELSRVREALIGYHGTQPVSEAGGSTQSEAQKKNSLNNLGDSHE